MSSAWCMVLVMQMTVGLDAVQSRLEHQHIERVLRDTPLSVAFQETPLHLAIHQLSEELGLSFRLDAAALAAEGVAEHVPVTLSLDSVSARSALSILLHQVQLRWLVQDGQVVVTTERWGRNRLYGEDYPIADLLSVEAEYVDERLAEKLRWVIVATVSPKEWDEVGGTGSIVWNREDRIFSVLQTRDVHDAVQELLDALRSIRDQEGHEMVGITLDGVLKVR